MVVHVTAIVNYDWVWRPPTIAGQLVLVLFGNLNTGYPTEIASLNGSRVCSWQARLHKI